MHKLNYAQSIHFTTEVIKEEFEKQWRALQQG